jgi:hypothetical protein
MRTLTTFKLLVSAALALCFVGRRAHTSDSQTFVTISIHVIDEATKQPLCGATLSPLCMGGTAYEKNVYQTDPRGTAKVMFYETSPGFVVKIERAGYETAFLSTPVKNAVLSLKRAQR